MGLCALKLGGMVKNQAPGNPRGTERYNRNITVKFVKRKGSKSTANNFELINLRTDNGVQ